MHGKARTVILESSSGAMASVGIAQHCPNLFFNAGRVGLFLVARHGLNAKPAPRGRQVLS
jgi:hypothetical protein